MQPAIQSPPILVRPVLESDFEGLLDMGVEFWAAVPHNGGIPYCRESLRVSFKEMLNQSLFLCAESESRLIGAIGGLSCPVFLNFDYTIVAELFWWVIPEKRKSGVGLKLMSAFEQAAKNAGAALLSMMLIEGSNTENLERIYSKSGYSPAERTWVKKLWQ